MNYLGLTVFAGNTPGIVLDFDKESKEYTIEFTDGRIVRTAVVNWEPEISADPEVAKYRVANRNADETLVFGEDGWDIISANTYWETGAPHEISQGEDADEDHMRSDIGGNSVLRHVEKELYNNRKDEEGNPEQDFVDDADEEVVQFPPVPHDVESFLERAESAEPDPMKTDREFPSGEYKERSRIPQHSHVREQAAWEDAHYANNPVCEDCGDPLVNGHCYSCLDKKKGISPEEYGAEEQETTIRQANKTAFVQALAPLAAPLLARLGIGAAAGGTGSLGTIGRMAGRAMMGQAMMAPFNGDDAGSTPAPSTPSPADNPAGRDYQSIALGATEPSEGIFAVEINGIDSHPENGGTGNYNAQHGDGPEYLKDVNDIGGALSAVRRFTAEDNIDSAIEEALGIVADGLPLIIEFADSEESAADNDAVKAFDELFEEVFGDDYASARDEEKGEKKKESRRVVADDQQDTVVCRKCNRAAVVGQRACSNVPALPDCPIVSVERMQTAPQGAQQQAAPAPAPTSTVPQTLNFPAYPRITKALKVAARKPKMCPYHADLVDYSVALKDPASALGALSQHQYSQNSCKGGWGEAEGTKCRFKPEMIHNEYWEEKEREAEERKQQREMQKAEEAYLQEENLLDPIEENLIVEEEMPETTEEAAPAFDPEFQNYAEPVVEMEMTNISEDSGPTYNDYIAPENYAMEAEPVLANNREWLREAAEEDVRVYEYPDEYEEGSADGSSIEDSDGNALEVGEVYRIGPEGELPDVVKVVSVDPQYVELERIDSSFPDNGGAPYRLTLKEIMVQDVQIDKVDGQLNPNEVGADSADALAGTPETNDDAGPGHNDLPGTTDLSSDRTSAFDHFSVRADVKKHMRWIRSLNRGLEIQRAGSDHFRVVTPDGIQISSFSGTPSSPSSLINNKKDIERQLRIMDMQAAGQDIDTGSRRNFQPQQQLPNPNVDPNNPIDPNNPNNKTAGYDYSAHEQKQFINEGGVARNLDKLDLSGTHYPDELSAPEDNDYFLWG